MSRAQRNIGLLCTGCFVWLVTAAGVHGQNAEIVSPPSYKRLEMNASPELQAMLARAVGDAEKRLKFAASVKDSAITATLINLSYPMVPTIAQVGGDRPIYSASVVKLYYMAALHRQLEDGKVRLTPELARGLRDMIVDSSNDATHYIVDVLTDTASGGEVPEAAFKVWQYKRNRVNRFFASMGYTHINVNQKTYCEDAYGIEQQSRNYKGENRNMLTTNATARLLAEIVLGRISTPERTRSMMELLKRDPFAPARDADDQASVFIGKGLLERKMTGAKIWSKAGWTDSVRHDVAYIETQDGHKFVLVVFTQNHSGERTIIPSIAARVLDGMIMAAPDLDAQ